MKKWIIRILIALAIPLLLLGGLILFQFYRMDQIKAQHAAYLSKVRDTASPHVRVLRDVIDVGYLGSKRSLYVYLPPNYEADSQRYPVLYFLDGNALFNDTLLMGPEWQLDEIMDSMAAIRQVSSIVIGIDNSPARSSEYKPFPDPKNSEEKEVSGDLHAQWIATDLKAWVDARYRTLPGREHTIIGGASLGGLMAYYLVTTYHQVFGGGIVLSPSFWVNEKVFDLHKQVPDLSQSRIYMNMGSREGPGMKKPARKVIRLLKESGMSSNNLIYDIEKGEGHWHPLWRKGVRKSYPWILGQE